jgi:hypothetical protein
VEQISGQFERNNSKKELMKINMENQRGIESRIQYLLFNPELGKEIIGTTSSGEPIKSNCFGTVMYLHNIPYPKARLDDSGFPMSYSGYRAELDMDSEFYPGLPWPGYIEAHVFKKALLKDFNKVEGESQFGDVYVFGDEDDMVMNGLKSRFLHAGIFLEKDRIFEQKKYGDVFGERTKWEAPTYTGIMTFRKK